MCSRHPRKSSRRMQYPYLDNTTVYGIRCFTQHFIFRICSVIFFPIVALYDASHWRDLVVCIRLLCNTSYTNFILFSWWSVHPYGLFGMESSTFHYTWCPPRVIVTLMCIVCSRLRENTCSTGPYFSIFFTLYHPSLPWLSSRPCVVCTCECLFVWMCMLFLFLPCFDFDIFWLRSSPFGSSETYHLSHVLYGT